MTVSKEAWVRYLAEATKNPKDIQEWLLSLYQSSTLKDLPKEELAGYIFQGYTKKFSLWGLDMSGVDFAGIDLSYRGIDRWDLSEANLSGANLKRSKISGSDLTSADLQRASLEYADIRGTDLSNANCKGASFQEARFQGVKFDGADFRGANLDKADLRGAKLTGVKMDGASLEGTNLDGAYVTDEQLRTTKSWERFKDRVTPEEAERLEKNIAALKTWTVGLAGIHGHEGISTYLRDGVDGLVEYMRQVEEESSRGPVRPWDKWDYQFARERLEEEGIVEHILETIEGVDALFQTHAKVSDGRVEVCRVQGKEPAIGSYKVPTYLSTSAWRCVTFGNVTLHLTLAPGVRYLDVASLVHSDVTKDEKEFLIQRGSTVVIEKKVTEGKWPEYVGKILPP